MAKKGRSVKGAFGTVTHYDEHGKKIGTSRPSAFGNGYNHYDAKGKRTGYSNKNAFGNGYTHYDAHGKKTGRSDKSALGGYSHYDAKGKSKGSTGRGVLNSYSHSDSQGCYVATCVYGSYDCPQVWTLRRFRDNTLAKRLSGRAFIRAYYAVSPTAVKLFGKTRWFKKLWRGVLDGFVRRLNENGVEDTPYKDINYK